MLSASDLDDLIEEDELEVEEKDRFRAARNGDHLMTPFQCDNCHFVNMRGTLPTESDTDKRLLLFTRRAILDSFWSRESSTVKGNLYLMKSAKKKATLFGLDDSFLPARGPFPVADDWGMTHAVLTLANPGRNSNHVQYQTIRKFRSTLSNLAHTCPGGLGPAFMSNDGAGARVSHSATNTDWSKRFHLGCHRRMGDIWKPNKALTRLELNSCFTILESEWEMTSVTHHKERLRISNTACLLISGYYGSLRGEELNRVHLGMIQKNWRDATRYIPAQHVPLMLVGRFKNVKGQVLFFQPLATVTNDGFDIKIWFYRCISSYAALDIDQGLLFRNKKGNKPSLAEMDILLHDVLHKVQLRYPSVIGDAVNIEDEFSVYRSLRRGANTEARNVRIPKDVIDANLRWRKLMRSQGMIAGFTMQERYTDTSANVPALVSFSRCLPMRE